MLCPSGSARACREVTKKCTGKMLAYSTKRRGSPGACGTCVRAPIKPFLLNSRSLGRKERGQQRLGPLDNVLGAWEAAATSVRGLMLASL